MNLQQLQIENAQGLVKLEGIWQNLLQCKCQAAECKVLLQQDWFDILVIEIWDEFWGRQFQTS